MAWREIIEDERYRLSSTRIVMLAASLVVILLALLDAFFTVTVDAPLVDALVWLALGAAVKAGADKHSPAARVDAEIVRGRATGQIRAIPDEETR